MFISNYITGIAMSNNTPILVTGAAGNVGSVGRGVVKSFIHDVTYDCSPGENAEGPVVFILLINASSTECKIEYPALRAEISPFI